MNFLNDELDLSDTRFSDEDLELARKFLVDAIQRHDPTWLDSPEGPLGDRWREGGLSQAIYLIHFGQMLSVIAHNSTSRSHPILARRFRSLLRANEQQYVEILTELQVIGVLIGQLNDGPVELEPLVDDNSSLSSPPRSPDYLVPTVGGPLYVEVTVFHLGVLRAWDEAAKRIVALIQENLIDRDVVRELSLSFPPNISRAQLNERQIRRLSERIANDNEGKATLRFNTASAIIEWSEPEVVVARGSPAWTKVGNLVEFPNANVQIGALIATNTKRLEADASEVVLSSLRNTLDRKRKQAPAEAHYIVAMHLGHHLINGQLLRDLVLERIWPNRKYRWLSAILAFEVRFTTDRGFETNMDFIPNPNADYQISVTVSTAVEQ